MDGHDIARLIALLGVAAILAPTIMFVLRDRGTAMRNAVIWIALGGAAALLWAAVQQP